MANKVQIDINTTYSGSGVKDVTTQLDGLEKQTQSTQKSSASFHDTLINLDVAMLAINEAVEIGSEAAQVLKQVYDATVGSTVALAEATKKTMEIIGATAEQASTLNGVAQILGISEQELATGMEAAIRKGLSPSIEGLKQLSEQYQSIQDPVAKTKFLMDTFGRSGADLNEIMELSGPQFDAYAQHLQDVGLVMSSQTIAQTIEYKRNTVELQQNLQGLGNQIGEALVPSLVDVTGRMIAASDAEKEQNRTWERGIPLVGSIIQLYDMLHAKTEGVSDAAHAAAGGMGDLQKAQYDMQPILSTAVGSMGALWESERNLPPNMSDIIKFSDPLTKSIASTQQAWDNGTLGASSYASAMHAAYDEMMKLIATSPQAAKLYQDYGKSSGQKDPNANPLAGVGSDPNNGYTGGGGTGFSGSGSGTSTGSGSGGSGHGKTNASGADYIVPPGYANEGWNLGTASSGEHVTITNYNMGGLHVNNAGAPINPVQEMRALVASFGNAGA